MIKDIKGHISLQRAENRENRYRKDVYERRGKKLRVQIILNVISKLPVCGVK